MSIPTGRKVKSLTGEGLDRPAKPPPSPAMGSPRTPADAHLDKGLSDSAKGVLLTSDFLQSQIPPVFEYTRLSALQKVGLRSFVCFLFYERAGNVRNSKPVTRLPRSRSSCFLSSSSDVKRVVKSYNRNIVAVTCNFNSKAPF